MASLIFPNSSYLLSVGANPTQVADVAAMAREQRIRTYDCYSKDDLDGALDVMGRVLGILLFDAKVTKPELEGVPVLILKEGADQQAISQAIDEIISGLVPPELEGALKESTEKILSRFFDKPPPLNRVKKIPFGFERQIYFSLVAGDLVGQGILRTNLGYAKTLLEESKRPTYLDLCREAMNQCLGLVLQKMSKIGLAAKTGLPTVFDTSAFSELQFLAYFPSVHLSDPESQFVISLGFTDIRGGKVSLKGLDSVDSSSDEVEFL